MAWINLESIMKEASYKKITCYLIQYTKFQNRQIHRKGKSMKGQSSGGGVTDKSTGFFGRMKMFQNCADGCTVLRKD